MIWCEIRSKYSNHFILLGNVDEKEIRKNTFLILGGEVLKVSTNHSEIQKAYREYQTQGKEVLYSIPSTPEEFIVEDIPYKGIL